MSKVNQWVMEMEECVMQSIELHGIHVSEEDTLDYVREVMDIVDEHYVRAYHQKLLNPSNGKYLH